jgi:protein O-GlcNAc transferase
MNDLPADVAALLALAHERHQAGDHAEAEALYYRVLALQPRQPKALHRMGILLIQKNQPRQAIGFIAQACAADSTNPYFFCARGMAHLMLGDFESASQAYTRAVTIGPEIAEAFYGLGTALQAGKQLDKAASAYQQALRLKPDHLATLNNLGNVLQLQDHPQEAAEIYWRALAINPDNVEVLNNLGSALQRLNRLNEAIDYFTRALNIRPDFLPGCNNLANSLVLLGRGEEAISMLQRAVALSPDFADAWYNLGNALRAAVRLPEAAAAYQRALAVKPDNADAMSNLGVVNFTLRQFKEAAENFREVLRRRPDDAIAYNNLGSTLRTMGAIDEAIIALRQALLLRPDYSAAYCNLGNVLKDTADLDAAIGCFTRATEINANDAVSHSNLAFTLQYHPDFDGPAILRENLRWNAIHARRVSGEIRPHVNDPNPDRRLRVGYVSPDFRDHCQSFFTLPLLANHDHQKVEVFCYSSVPRPDEVTQRVEACVDNWRPAAALGDGQLAEQIRADKIDILIDLTMHMSGGRPLLFARKPAPVQVAWLAYPGTTGLSAIDYRLTDPYLDPPGDGDLNYSEQSIRLPFSFWCYDPLTDEPAVNELPALDEGHFTFGCLNNFCKVTEPTLELWSRAMKAVPDSRLILLAAAGRHRQRVLDQLAELGIEAGRVEFVGYQKRADYLKVYHRIDVGLDTIPYNGHTTSLDSFWMGVPVITRIGRTAVGRAGLSQLSNLGLNSLAAANDEEFVRIVVELSRDLAKLSELRAGLRQRLRGSPLCDGATFARHVESAYRQMWRHWCQFKVGVAA